MKIGKRRLRKIEKRLLNLERLAVADIELRELSVPLNTRELWAEQTADYSYYGEDEDEDDEGWQFLGYI